MKLELNVVKKEFVNEQGEKLSYYECSVLMNGEKFVLKPRAEDKKMFNYFLKDKVK